MEGRRPWLWLLGLGALFSGVALLANILAGVSLPLGLAITVGLLLVLVVVAGRQLDPETRAVALARLKVGLVAGLVATLAYDAAKWGLSQLDPSPYNPFEALKVFGGLLLGAGTDEGWRLVAGTGLHLVNGIAFGVAYGLLLGRLARSRIAWAVLSGAAWGLFLEVFQLTLYPGWLNIRFYEEFVQISALSHVVYGIVLGLGCHVGLRRLEREEAPDGPR